MRNACLPVILNASRVLFHVLGYVSDNGNETIVVRRTLSYTWMAILALLYSPQPSRLCRRSRRRRSIARARVERAMWLCWELNGHSQNITLEEPRKKRRSAHGNAQVEPLERWRAGGPPRRHLGDPLVASMSYASTFPHGITCKGRHLDDHQFVDRNRNHLGWLRPRQLKRVKHC